MKSKRKIFKKILSMAIHFVALIVYFTLLSFSTEKMNQKEYKNITINICPQYLKFLNDEDVKTCAGIKDNEVTPMHFKSIYTSYKNLKRNAWLENIYIYQNARDEIVIECNQRKPFFRVQTIEGYHLYVDSSGKLLPAVRNFACHVPFANGYIFENYTRHKEIFNIFEILENKSLSAVFHTSEIWKVLNEINKDSLLKILIQNIYVNKSGEIILIPNIGQHRVFLGNTDRLEYKLKKLSVFYREAYLKTPAALNYSKISLQFKNQIVCTMN